MLAVFHHVSIIKIIIIPKSTSWRKLLFWFFNNRPPSPQCPYTYTYSSIRFTNIFNFVILFRHIFSLRPFHPPTYISSPSYSLEIKKKSAIAQMTDFFHLERVFFQEIVSNCSNTSALWICLVLQRRPSDMYRMLGHPSNFFGVKNLMIF